MDGAQITDAVLLIIDMQNDYVHRDGASLRYFRGKRDGRDVGGRSEPSAGERIVPQLKALIGAARSAGVPIVWVRSENDDETASPMALAQGKRFVWAGDDWGTAFYQGLEPLTTEKIVTKHRHSAFFDTDLDQVLGGMGAQTLILTGVSTPYCVESTARDGFARDYAVVTVADATASKVRGEHEDALSRLGRVFGKVTTSEQLMVSWRRRPELLEQA